ncbi:YceH family protein [Pedobacter sp.]|uniref:YceH family protein n=1 Tax=Pedobacter sp. TaxID=1411316 RepID=UPI00396C4038
MNETLKLPLLDAAQIRVLGSLIEKSKTTPDYYPMTLNGLLNACNQKSSRKPVVNYDEATVVSALNGLKITGLSATVTGGSIRNIKYKHNLAVAYPLLPPETTVLCLLFLRGALTPGEINSNSGRMYEFESLEEVNEILQKLSSEGYIKLLAKRPGQKEQRYMHLFSGDVEDMDFDEDIVIHNSSDPNALEDRLNKAETELAELKERFEALLKELGV